jgi:4-amino-4-deoxy-L-arabinose transferase-like glycosyltransferase
MIERLLKSGYSYLLILVFYLIGLWLMSVPMTGDQKVYISVALEMRERGEWIIPYLFNEANFLKPPFQYWATLVGWNIFGLSLFGALIPSVIALLVSANFTNRISAILTGQNSYLPGLLFASSLGSMTYGTTGQMEIWIVCFYLWAWYEFMRQNWIRAFVVVGIMAWIKGPLYPVLWVLSSWLYLGFQHEERRVLSKRYLVGLFVGVSVGLLWYALAARTHLQPMLDVFLLRENMAKTQTSQGTPQGLWGEFIYTLFPWVFWLILTLSSRDGRQSIKKYRYFYLSYALIPALFFTFFPYRVNTYLYLLTPIAAMMCGGFSKIERNTVTRLISALVMLIAIAFSVFNFRLLGGGWIGFEVAGPLFLILALWAYFYFQLNLSKLALVSLMMVNLIRMGAVELGEKDLQGLRAFHEADHAPLAYLIEYKDIWHEYGLVSSALKTDIQRLYNSSEYENFLNHGGAVILQEGQMAEHLNDLNCIAWPRLRKRIKFPFKKLIQSGLNFGDPELMRSYQICKKLDSHA